MLRKRFGEADLAVHVEDTGTRPDPFDGVWEDEIEPLLRNDPTGRLKATTIIDWLAEQHSGRFRHFLHRHDRP